MTEGEALKKKNFSYYEQLKVRLDLVLTFTELGEYRMRLSTATLSLNVVSRRLQTNIPIYCSAGPIRDPDHQLMFTYILLG